MEVGNARQHEARYHVAYTKRFERAYHHVRRSFRGLDGRAYGRLRVAARPKAEGRAKALSGRARASVLALFLLVASFGLFPCVARADQIIYGPVSYTWEGVSYSQYGVVASSKYDAALVSLGFDSSEFDATAKAKLSNESTGGAFYTYAQKFENPDPSGYSLTPQGVVPGFWATAYGIYGEGNVWYAEVTLPERIAAGVDARIIKSGGDIGGGSSPDIPEGYTQITGGSIDGYVANLTKYSDSATLTSFSIDFSNNNSAKRFIDSYDNIIVVAGSVHGTSNLVSIVIFGYDDGLLFLSKDAQEVSPAYYYKTVSDSVKYSVSYSYTASGVSNGVTVLGQGGGSSNTETVTNSTPSQANRSLYCYYVACKGGSAPVVPPTNWPEPDPPATPQPPEVDPPTTPDPPNVPTTPTPPTYPPQVTYPDVTYVEADLSAVLDALNEHCEHLQDSIYQNSVNLYNSLQGTISGEFTSLKTFMRNLASWNVQAMNDNFDALYTYLTDFAVWLDSRMRADDIVDILMRIYGMMPDSVDLSTVESDLSDIVADVELIVQALNNLQDSNGLETVRGYLKGMYDWLYDLDLSGVGSDLSVLEHQLTDLTESDNVTLTVRGLLHWINHYAAEVDRTMHDVYDELSSFTSDCAQFWADLKAYLDDILDALDNLEITPRVRYTPTEPPEIPVAPELDADLNLDALRDALSRLMEKFPFSTINNFVLILTLLTRPAQAPIFDLPLPNPSDWSNPYMVNVDLSIWDVPAAVLRTGIVIWAIARVSRRTVSMWTREEGGGQ